MPTTTTLNFGVIGCGVLAQSQHIANIAANPHMSLHTCCDLSDEALTICRDSFKAGRTTKNFKEVVSDPEIDIIVLATTESLRLPVIELAAKHGKPIYVEKPMAATLAETYAIQKVVNESGIPFCVGHNRRSSPAMIEANAIFRSHMTNPKPCPWRWERDPDLREKNRPDDGIASMSVRINDDWYSWKHWAIGDQYKDTGAMLFEMTHFTDLCNWFLASEPVEVSSISCHPFNHAVIIRYENGELATILMCSHGTFGYPKELYEVMGNGGIVAIDHMLEIRTAGIEGAPVHKTYPMLTDRHPNVGQEGGFTGWLAKKRAACDQAVTKSDNRLIFTAEPDKGHARALNRFVEQITSKGPEVCGVDSAVRATRVSFAAIKSAAEHRPVQLSEI